MKLVWVTDPHLSFLKNGGDHAFGARVRREHRDLQAIVVTGDIGEYANFGDHIERFAKGANARVWFVLGNHDAYGGSVAKAQARAAGLDGLARWLPSSEPVELGTSGAWLVGDDGFYDGRYGLGVKSSVVLSDFMYIEELAGAGAALLDRIQTIADEAAKRASAKIDEALARGPKRVVFATHVPPFAEAAWHEGAGSDGHWLPWMSSKVMGEMLLDKAHANPQVSFEVLCGHTHGKGEVTFGENLLVRTGDAEYRAPRVCGVVEA